MSRRAKLRVLLGRVRRFAPAAWRSLRFDARRAGEHVPVVCQQSEFVDWLWEARMDWRLWSLRIGDRMVMVDNWGRSASAEEWTWLASRPALVADGQPSPADPAWWEEPAAHAHEAWLSENPAASAMVQRGLQEADRELLDEARSWISWAVTQRDLTATAGLAHGEDLAARLRAQLTRVRAGTVSTSAPASVRWAEFSGLELEALEDALQLAGALADAAGPADAGTPKAPVRATAHALAAELRAARDEMT